MWVHPDDPDHPHCFSGRNLALEHRLVVGRSLGRVLQSNESVHHINGDRLDNRLENLQLRSRYHGDGHSHTCLDCGSTNVQHSKLQEVS